MQKNNQQLNNVVESNQQKKESTNPFKKLINFNKDNFFVKKTPEEKRTFIKQLLILIPLFLLMVGSVVGATFAIIEAKKVSDNNKSPATMSLVVENKK